MFVFIDSAELLEEVVETELKPYCANKSNILALDTETYNTSLAGTVVEEELITFGEPEYVDEVLTVPLIKAAVSLKTKKALKSVVPRPLPQKDGSLTGVMRLLQLGLNPNSVASLGGKQFVIDAPKIGYETVGRLLKPILEDQLILGHNLKYDFVFLYACLGIYLNRMVDTMLVAQILGAGVQKGYSLIDLYDRCLDFKWFADNTGKTIDDYRIFKKNNQQLEDWSGELLDTQIKYAADDAYFIHIVWDKLKEEIKEFCSVNEQSIPATKGIKFVMRLECNSIPMYSMMEYRGLKIDINHQKNVVIPRLEQSRDNVIAKINLTKTYEKKFADGRGKNRKVWFETVTEPINLRSHAQLKPALYDLLYPYADGGRITVKINKRHEEKPDKFYLRFAGEELELTTEEKLIKRLLNEDEIRDYLPDSVCDVLVNLLQYKQATSLLSKFGQKIIDSCTDRGYVHPSWFPIGADSGRMACRGLNIQQIPSRGLLRDGTETKLASLFRSSICSEEGWVLIGADYSQIEARYAAKWCNQAYLVRKYNSNEDVDIHGENGKVLLGLSYIPKPGDENRDVIGKTAGFSILYGAFPKKLKRFMFDQTDGKVNWTDEQAKQAWNRFFEGYPEFKVKQQSYRNLVESLIRDAGYNLYQFKFKTETGKVLPFHIARGELGLCRPRQFALPPEYRFLTQLQLAKNYEMTPDERVQYKLRFGNFYSNVVEQASREGFNHSIQSSCADLLKLAAWLIHNKLLELGIPMEEGIIALVHDEILLHVREKNATLVRDLVEECMQEANDILDSGIAVKATAKIGKTWYAVH